jgi:phosphoglucosamine mutase
MEKRIFERTDGIRGKVGEEPLTRKTIRRLGGALGRYFGHGKIVIGRDTRESSEWIRSELIRGLEDTDVEIIDIGIATSPVTAMMTKLIGEVVGGIIITASHNPASDNGIKVFDRDGHKMADGQELKIEKIFFDGWKEREVYSLKDTEYRDIMNDYMDELSVVVDHAMFSKYKVLVDSAAGGGKLVSEGVMRRFGVDAKEIGPIPDGMNINENCGAMHPENLAKAVVKEGADMGVALDGDADRIILVDDIGRVWDGDRMLAMLAVELKRDGKLPGNTVVMTEYSNLGAVNYVKNTGIEVEKVVVGDREVARKCEEIGAVLGGEMAGHIIYLPWLSSSDGVMVAMMTLSILKKRGAKLSSLWPEYELVPQKLWNMNVKEKIPLEEIDGWSEAMDKWSNYLGNEGRLFARYSGTEKKLRIMVESMDEKKMTKAGEALSKIIEEKIGNE